jgi:hypothetical protein
MPEPAKITAKTEPNLIGMWWSYHKLWVKSWSDAVFHRAGKSRDHLLSALGSGIGILIGFRLGWITSEHLLSVLLMAVLGYLVLIVIVWVWWALFVSAKISYFQQQKTAELDAKLNGEICFARRAGAEYIRQSVDVIRSAQRARVAEGMIGPMKRELADAYAIIARLQPFQDEVASLKRLVETKDKEIATLKSPELPALRPRVVPVGYGKPQGRVWAGLLIANDGEPAYDISIPPVKLGTSLIEIEPEIHRLTKEDGQKFCKVWIRQEHRGTTTGNDLMTEMINQSISDVRVSIFYNDDEHRYVTAFRIMRDVSARGLGISVKDYHQDILPLPIPLAEHDPKIVPSCNWTPAKYTEQIWQERPITLLNSGGGDAKDIEISRIKRCNGEAEFESVGFIAKGESTIVTPQIFGPNRTQAPFGMADLLHLMDSEYQFVGGNPTVNIDFVIRYRDSAEHSFVTTAKLIRNPLKGTTEFKELKFMREDKP